MCVQSLLLTNCQKHLPDNSASCVVRHGNFVLKMSNLLRKWLFSSEKLSRCGAAASYSGRKELGVKHGNAFDA